MGSDSLTRCGKLTGRRPAGNNGGIEGPLLPQGSGDGQSPEELRAQEVYNARMWLFEHNVRERNKRRTNFNDFTTKNCEEAWGNRQDV